MPEVSQRGVPPRAESMSGAPAGTAHDYGSGEPEEGPARPLPAGSPKRDMNEVANIPDDVDPFADE